MDHVSPREKEKTRDKVGTSGEWRKRTEYPLGGIESGNNIIFQNVSSATHWLYCDGDVVEEDFVDKYIWAGSLEKATMKKFGGKTVEAAKEDDLVMSMGRLSMRSSPAVRVPPLSAYAIGKPAVAVAGKEVVVGEMIPKAEAIPDNFPSTYAYLKAMQAHAQHEFAASVRESVTTADRTKGGGWMPLTCRPDPRKPDKLAFSVNGAGSGHDFSTDPWSRLVIQIEGESIPALVVVCREGHTKRNAFLTIASAKGFGRGGVPARSLDLDTRVRSLGYAGPFLQQYGKAAMLLKKGGGRLLVEVALLGRQGAAHGSRGTFVPAAACALNTSHVPLNPAQRDAVLNLTGGLDIIVGPPGTGKSTTIFHVIDARVRQDARVLVTSTRNQAVDAVTEKVHIFGVLVLGNEPRLGKFSRQFKIDGRLQNDQELVSWRSVQASWAAALRIASQFSWREQYLLPNFPGISHLRDLEKASFAATGAGKKAKALRKRGRAAALWAFALESVIQANYYKRLENGNRSQRRTFRQLVALTRYQALLQEGLAWVEATLRRLELLTRLRFLTTTRVFLSTIDSSEGSLRRLKRDITETATALRLSPKVKLPPVTFDTVIVDEAACVLETAVPVLLSLGIQNLTLVGDHNQLRPFSHVRESNSCMHHSRSLMERAIESGFPKQFLDTQYRMHPKICDIVSSTFYDNKLLTAEILKIKRRANQPCKWIHVSGGEIKHKDRGYSNPREIPPVVKQARAALRRYGAKADIRVITFYNMQKHALERAFKKDRGLKKILIVSVDSCQGSDADVIIISTVRSGVRKLSGFMTDRSRVNVAISRAKEECIFVGDRDTMRAGGGAMWQLVGDHYTS